MKSPNFNSLKTRYLLLSISLVIIITTMIAISENHINSTGNKFSKSIKQSASISKIIESLHSDISIANRELNLYLISPNATSRDTLTETFSNMHSTFTVLKRSPWIKNNLVPLSIQEFDQTVSSLKDEAIRVMDIRINIDEMYPSYSIANGSMLETNNDIIDLINFAITEKSKHKTFGSEQHILLLELRDKWRTLINDYRIYLLNRIGSLFEVQLNDQAQDVEKYFRHIKYIITNLEKTKYNSNTDFETEIAIDQLSTLVEKWYSDFEIVIEINKSSNWRRDIAILSNKIYPMFNKINFDMEYISSQVYQTSNLNLLLHKKSLSTISRNLWSLAAFVVGFIIISSFFLIKNLLAPLEKLSESLKLEAQGQHSDLNLNVTTTEMKNFINAFREMQYQVHSRQLALEHMAMHDALTSLPNRALLIDRLEHALNNEIPSSCSLSLLFLDLDRFKEINDTLGHAAGDILLCLVAERLKKCLRENDTVARLGGDEFAILLPNTNIIPLTNITKKIVNTLEEVYHILDHNLYVGISIGIANFPEHGTNASTLIQHADIAMYQSKRSNTNISTYDPDKDIHNIEQLSLLADLKTAIINNEMLLYYQPIISLKTNILIGFEALIRWSHPIYGMVAPDKFIPIAEQTGIIKAISRWVIKQAIIQCTKWHSFKKEIYTTVNLSVWDLQDPTLEVYIKDMLNQYQLEAKYLSLEITESAMMADAERAKEILKKLNDMGLSIAIDDYGTGFSSLAYLKQLPVNTLKIDRSFVTNMDVDNNDETIVRSTIELAHNLGLEVIAEGVETKRIMELLRALKCDKAQGYYIDKPLAAADATKRLGIDTEKNTHSSVTIKNKSN